MESSRRFLLRLRKGSNPLEERQISDFASLVHDRMTECVYPVKLITLHTSATPDPVIVIPVIERGRQALEEINVKMGLAFDVQDIQYYTRLFRDDIKRNPTTVELFDIAQSNTSTAGYCVGNLHIEGAYVPLEDLSFTYPSNLASPLQSLVSASDGASDYGNKFGEPLIQGYTRTFGMRLPNGEQREWMKPIMFSGGIGQIDHVHISKGEPEIGMLVVKIGGPAYQIGMRGGATSSMVSGQNDADLK